MGVVFDTPTPPPVEEEETDSLRRRGRDLQLRVAEGQRVGPSLLPISTQPSRPHSSMGVVPERVFRYSETMDLSNKVSKI